MAHIIVVGNEKGGAGKSTVCDACRDGACSAWATASALIDLGSQATQLSGYYRKPPRDRRRKRLALATPEYRESSGDRNPASLGPAKTSMITVFRRRSRRLEEHSRFHPDRLPRQRIRGSAKSRIRWPTRSITPLNDSFVDFDLLARRTCGHRRIIGPSVYSEMVWNARQLRAQAGLDPIDWVVVRNRLGAQADGQQKEDGGSR